MAVTIKNNGVEITGSEVDNTEDVTDQPGGGDTPGDGDLEG